MKHLNASIIFRQKYFTYPHILCFIFSDVIRVLSYLKLLDEDQIIVCMIKYMPKYGTILLKSLK